MVKVRRRRKRRGPRLIYALSFVVFLLSSFLVYFLSDDSRVKAMTCTGNYYYTDQEIYEQAGLSVNTRLFLSPSFLIERSLNDLPLVKSANVTCDNGKISIQVSETTVIGYYIEEDVTYLLTLEGDAYSTGDASLPSTYHFPYLNGLSQEQRSELCALFNEHSDKLTRDIIGKISEIEPYESSYDTNMLKITMQDGNTVYTTFSSLVMLGNYQGVLTQLEGVNACLLLDADNSAIEKVDCASIGKKKDDSEKTDEDTDEETADTSEDQTPQSPATDETTQTTTDYYSMAADWQTDSTFGLEYSASLNLYYDPYTGTYYTWNESTLSFDTLN